MPGQHSPYTPSQYPHCGETVFLSEMGKVGYMRYRIPEKSLAMHAKDIKLEEMKKTFAEHSSQKGGITIVTD